MKMTKRAAATVTPAAEVTRVGFAPIIRVDTARREIELCATSEALDTYGTVFSYEASRDAFERWAGNVREMHARKAVGRRVAVRCDDATRKVYVRVRISGGAPDTWEKVLDGTLRGASIGASNVEWARERREIGGRSQEVPIARRYDLVELSLVDLPSNPDAEGILIVRDGVPVAALLDELEESAPANPAPAQGESAIHERHTNDAADAPAPPTAVGAASIERATSQDGPRPARAARLASLGAPGYVQMTLPMPQADASAMPASPDPAGSDAQTDRARGAYSNNPDGPPDTGVPARATERPTADAYGQPSASDTPEGNREEVLHTAARAILLACGCPDCQSALAALDPSSLASEEPHETGEVRAAALVTRALAAHTERLESTLRAVHGSVGQLAGTLDTIARRVAAIEAQPLPGGPQLRVADKTHALLPNGGQSGAGEQIRALEALAGRLTDPQAQIAVATEMIRLQQEAAGLPPDLQIMPRAGAGAGAR
jgi:hypothetical protein